MKNRFLAAAALAAALAAAGGLTGCATAPAPKPAAAKPLPDDAVVTWTDDAWQAFQAEVPKAVQKIAKKQAEKEARQAGLAVIDMTFYQHLKDEQGRSED